MLLRGDGDEVAAAAADARKIFKIRRIRDCG